MNIKKIVSGVLAVALVLSLTVCAFATESAPTPVKVLAETSESEFNVELEGMIYTPTIRVQVTESGNVYVNPTGSVIAGSLTKALDGSTNLDYSFTCTTGNSTSKKVSVGIASTPILIRSDTDKALNVSASATANVPKSSGITLVAADPASAEGTDKQAYLFVSGNKTALGDSSVLQTTEEDGVVTPGITEKNSGLDGKGLGKAELSNIGSDKKSATAESAKVATIGAATQNKDTTGKVTTAVPQYGVVVVGGNVNPNATGWTENDIVNVTVALTFSIA